MLLVDFQAGLGFGVESASRQVVLVPQETTDLLDLVLLLPAFADFVVHKFPWCFRDGGLFSSADLGAISSCCDG
jgi:hypothetical protein